MDDDIDDHHIDNVGVPDDLTRLQMILMVFMFINFLTAGTQTVPQPVTTTLCLLRSKALLIDDHHGNFDDEYDNFDDDHHHQRYDNHHSPVGTQRILQPMTIRLFLLRSKALLIDDHHDDHDHFDNDRHPKYSHFPVGTQRILQPMTMRLCLLRSRIYLPLWESQSLKGICQGITHNISRSILTHNTSMLVL